MSLINRMLRDLSSRQPDAGNVMTGIQVPPSVPRRSGSAAGRLGLLVVLVAVFTAGLWWMFGPKPVKQPQPRGIPAGSVAATGAPAAEAPAPPADTPQPLVARAPEQKPAHLQIDPELGPPTAAPAPAPKAAPPPAAELREAPRLEPAPPKPTQAGESPGEPPVVAAPVEPPAPAPTSGVTPAAPRKPKAEDLYADAQRATQRGDLKEAEAALIEALALDPKLHAAREELGTLRIRQGRLDEAEKNVRIGLETEPGWIGYRRLLARLELARRRPAAALEALANDAPPVENDTEYHALLASAYQRLNRHEEASRTFRALTEAQPDNASWWAGYAMSRDALGDVSGALAGYARARQTGGLDPRVLEHINRRTAVLQSAG